MTAAGWAVIVAGDEMKPDDGMPHTSTGNPAARCRIKGRFVLRPKHAQQRYVTISQTNHHRRLEPSIAKSSNARRRLAAARFDDLRHRRSMLPLDAGERRLAWNACKGRESYQHRAAIGESPRRSTVI